MDAKEKREVLAKADFCMAFIHINGFLTDTENDKVFQRISKWQDKHKVSITEEQIFLLT